MSGGTRLHTLGARNNSFLDILQGYLKADARAMRAMIHGLLSETRMVLATKGIDYGELRSALVPNSKRREVALVFDTARIRQGWYGLPVSKSILPLLSSRGSHSVLEGDCVGENEHQEWIHRRLEESIHLASPLHFEHSTQFHVVYINNLSDDSLPRMHAALTRYGPYVGSIDTTLSSPMKTYLALCLVNGWLQHKSYVIQGHEDDVDDDQNVNMLGYPFEEHGLRCRSLRSTLFDLFMSYKIERPVLEGRETDTLHSLSAISPLAKPIANFAVRIDSEKLDYLQREKAGTMERAGLSALSRERLESLIASKITSNYIYNLAHDEVHGTVKFNVLIEVECHEDKGPARVTVSLEYLPQTDTLRLITLF